MNVISDNQSTRSSECCVCHSKDMIMYLQEVDLFVCMDCQNVLYGDYSSYFGEIVITSQQVNIRNKKFKTSVSDTLIEDIQKYHGILCDFEKNTYLRNIK